MDKTQNMEKYVYYDKKYVQQCCTQNIVCWLALLIHDKVSTENWVAERNGRSLIISQGFKPEMENPH